MGKIGLFNSRTTLKVVLHRTIYKSSYISMRSVLMPRYNPAVIEPKWQKFWEENRTFAAPKLPKGRKLYVLDMFPYPSGDGLHVGHPEGYTATDIVCRFNRMQGTSVMHPMGWDAFGLPAEQHAKKTGTHPRPTTEKNIANFRRQLKMLGFSYDWDRELATTDVEYFRWTQFIFLVLFDTWFDEAQQRGRPIAELPIPADVADEGEEAVARYRDEHRLAYQLEAPVNWCPALGTVLANEEVSRRRERARRASGRPHSAAAMDAADHRLCRPAGKRPRRARLVRRHQARCSATGSAAAPGRRSISSSACLPTKTASRSQKEYEGWLVDRKMAGWPRKPDEEVLRIYTTRPDTLFGATYMVIAPGASVRRAADHARAGRRGPRVLRTGGAQKRSGPHRSGQGKDRRVHRLVCDQSGQRRGDSDLGGRLRADQLRHRARSWPCPPTTPAISSSPSSSICRSSRWSIRARCPDLRERRWDCPFSNRDDLLAGRVAFIADGTVDQLRPLQRPDHAGVQEENRRRSCRQRASAAARSTTNSAIGSSAGSISGASRSRSCTSWTPTGKPTGRIRALKPEDLPLDLPAKMTFDAKHDEPTPPLDKAPDDWLYVTLDGKRYKRETNTMPQWAGSCWYYLRFLDPKNNKALVDPEIEKAWMPVDLYVGGAEHAVLHLLYARFWHKVLFDRGYVSMPEPFQKLVNQGMILGEMEFTGYQTDSGQWISATEVADDAEGNPIVKKSGQPVKTVKVAAEQVEKQGETFVLKADAKIRIDSRAYKMSKSRGNVVNPDEVVTEYGADALRLYEMFMGPLEAVKPWSMDGVSGVRGFLDRVWRMIIDDRAEAVQLNRGRARRRADGRAEPHVAQDDQGRDERPGADVVQHGHRADDGVHEFLPQGRSAAESGDGKVRAAASRRSPRTWPRNFGRPWAIRKRWPTSPGPRSTRRRSSEDTIEVPVQVNGKLRGRIQAPADADNATLESLARADAKIAELLAGKTVVKVIIIPGKMVNFVVK